MCLEWAISTLIVTIAHLYSNTCTLILQLLDRISIYRVCVSRWVFSLNKSECHALFILLLLLKWLEMRQSHDCWPHISSGMPEMILKLASSNWPSKGQAKAEDKYRILAATKLWCIFNFFLSTLFKKQIFFVWFWANISIKITH